MLHYQLMTQEQLARILRLKGLALRDRHCNTEDSMLGYCTLNLVQTHYIHQRREYTMAKEKRSLLDIGYRLVDSMRRYCISGMAQFRYNLRYYKRHMRYHCRNMLQDTGH